MKSGKILLGVLAGAAAGALIGVLLAPDKGVETRKKITKKGEDYIDSLKGKFNEYIEGFSKKMDNAREEMTDINQKHKHNGKETKKNVQHADA